ncbi:hypothetical protein [Sediminicola sp. 1XM1-17]|uniref:hypothetical protein n=1 Tax=Sediminicola sp. 1XM1-17 TaxID=3127702 RepID=UPI00307751F1
MGLRNVLANLETPYSELKIDKISIGGNVASEMIIPNDTLIFQHFRYGDVSSKL